MLDVCEHGSLRRKCEVCDLKCEVCDLKAELAAANERIKELEANVKSLTYNRVIKFDVTDEDHLSIKLLEETIASMQKQIDMLVADTYDEASELRVALGITK